MARPPSMELKRYVGAPSDGRLHLRLGRTTEEPRVAAMLPLGSHRRRILPGAPKGSMTILRDEAPLRDIHDWWSAANYLTVGQITFRPTLFFASRSARSTSSPASSATGARRRASA